MTLEISPALLLRAYSAGIFPMADSAEDPEVFWVDPELRGVLPLDEFHLSKRLARTIRSGRFEVHCDTDFAAIIHGCAESTEQRQKTWINHEIAALYTSLNRQGFAHSVECWCDGRLVGGLYGVALGGAFFGESMFSRERDASKVALAHLVAILRQGAFTLLDVQFVTPHLQRFGAIEIPRAEYHRLLDEALRHDGQFAGELGGAAVVSVLQSRTLTS